MPRWKYSKEGTENIVEFSGNYLDENGEAATVKMRFSVKEEDSTFIMNYWEINGVPQDNSNQFAFLKNLPAGKSRRRNLNS